MPNWCENILRVRGEPEELEKFRLYASDSEDQGEHYARRLKGEKIRPLEEGQFVPYPREFRILDEANLSHKSTRKLTDEEKEWLEKKGLDTKKDGFNQGGYDWQVKNWGTKWGFCHTGLVETARELIYDFETAWSPPEPLIRAMAEKFPRLDYELRYVEPGVAFRGILSISGGKVQEDWTEDFDGSVESEEEFLDSPLIR